PLRHPHDLSVPPVRRCADCDRDPEQDGQAPQELPARPRDQRGGQGTRRTPPGLVDASPSPPPPSYAPIPPTMANLSTFRAGPEGGGGGLCFDLRHARLREPLVT